MQQSPLWPHVRVPPPPEKDLLADELQVVVQVSRLAPKNK